jgi:glycine/D-amino acid oxidase-like deaminating enzyme
MNPLYRNDRPGAYPPSWYVASTDLPPERPQLRGEVTADVAVLGAGYTGLWAAKVLAERGLKVVVIEAHRVGWGASGRNGGQVAAARFLRDRGARGALSARRRPWRLFRPRGGRQPGGGRASGAGLWL